MKSVLVNLPFHMECQLYTPFDQYHCRNGGRLNIWLCDWISQQFHGIYQRRPTALRYWSNPHGNFESQFVIPRKIISTIKIRIWNCWKIAKNQYNLFTLTFFLIKNCLSKKTSFQLLSQKSFEKYNWTKKIVWENFFLKKNSLGVWHRRNFWAIKSLHF